MAWAVSRRPLTMEARVRSPFSPCGNYGGQIGTGTGQYHSTDVQDSYSSACCSYPKAGPSLGGNLPKISAISEMAALWM